MVPWVPELHRRDEDMRDIIRNMKTIITSGEITHRPAIPSMLEYLAMNASV
jgi:hypothetical protein